MQIVDHMVMGLGGESKCISLFMIWMNVDRSMGIRKRNNYKVMPANTIKQAHSFCGARAQSHNFCISWNI